MREVWIDIILILNSSLPDDGKRLIHREYKLNRFGSYRVRAAFFHYLLQTIFLPVSSGLRSFRLKETQNSYPLIISNLISCREEQLTGIKNRSMVYQRHQNRRPF